MASETTPSDAPRPGTEDPGSGTDAAIESVSVLGDDSRRRMFAFIRRARRPVTRDEAATTVGISRKLAAFHLDKLVDAGLLRARYGPPGGVRKVGRQPKVYEPSGTRIELSIPDRRHELLADMLLRAVLTEGRNESGREAAVRTAGERGRELGETQRSEIRPGRLGAERGVTVCEQMLEGHGFEPVRETPTRLRLRNCPFHPLAAEAPELVCAMNHAFLSGYLDGMRAASVEAVLAPRPGECCVEISATGSRDERDEDGTEDG